jgi:tRNA (guanine-N7-)-methyltransferase
MPRVRVHQHVNPLAPRFQEISPPLDFAEAFADPTRPLHLDIGCARGRFLLRMAQIEPDWNFLGLEIREPLVHEANRIAAEHGLENLHYEYCNATIALANVLANLPPGVLRQANIQFPDPWFKKRHFKRRMVKPQMIADLYDLLAEGGKVLTQSDVEEVADEIFGFFNERGGFRQIAINENPFPVKTEREQAVQEKGLPIYRMIFEKISV